jgi:hypothetical protein
MSFSHFCNFRILTDVGAQYSKLFLMKDEAAKEIQWKFSTKEMNKQKQQYA